MLSSRFAGIPISSSTIDGPGVPQWLNRGEQNSDVVAGSGGRLQIGMVADIKSEFAGGTIRRPRRFEVRVKTRRFRMTYLIGIGGAVLIAVGSNFVVPIG